MLGSQAQLPAVTMQRYYGTIEKNLLKFLSYPISSISHEPTFSIPFAIPLLSFLHLPWVGKGSPQVSDLFSLQIHRLASQCIQKNVAVFLAVKDWSWWQLLGSLRPLLSSTIGDEQLHAKEVSPRGRQGAGWPLLLCTLMLVLASGPSVSTLQILDLEMLCPSALTALFQISLGFHQCRHRPPSVPCLATL